MVPKGRTSYLDGWMPFHVLLTVVKVQQRSFLKRFSAVLDKSWGYLTI